MQRLQALRDNIRTVLYGQDEAIELTMICFLAGGNLLIEDVPGVGKTTLASAFSQSLGLVHRRMQFTADILPSDILGVSIFDPEKSAFVFHEGPVFTNILLADEINRAEPRAQSALLEAMFEKQVTVDGVTRALPNPFMVIATQNPVDFSGTFPLPDSQLDRFLFCIRMGYPDEASEREILKNGMKTTALSPVLTEKDAIELRASVAGIHASEEILDLVLHIVHATRENAMITQGASTRAMSELLHAAKARALVHGREFVLPDDIRTLAPHALAHRVRTAARANVDPQALIASFAVYS